MVWNTVEIFYAEKHINKLIYIYIYIHIKLGWIEINLFIDFNTDFKYSLL